MIGKFDEETIKSHQDKFLLGKLVSQETETTPEQMKIFDVNCSKSVLESANPDDDFDEILAEILAEEEAARNAKEAEDEEKRKKKEKKKKQKKQKNKNKSKKNKDGEFFDWEKEEL